MSLTIFLAICILGCDVLIYFLYEWAFGESKRIRKRQARSRLWASSEDAPVGYSLRAERNSPGAVRVIDMDRKRGNLTVASTRPNVDQERLAYRRLATSFVQLKPRT